MRLARLGLDCRAPACQSRVVKSCGPPGLRDLAFQAGNPAPHLRSNVRGQDLKARLPAGST
jgi:hypothetical protein